MSDKWHNYNLGKGVGALRPPDKYEKLGAVRTVVSLAKSISAKNKLLAKFY